jgi:hypothetical protein
MKAVTMIHVIIFWIINSYLAELLFKIDELPVHEFVSKKSKIMKTRREPGVEPYNTEAVAGTQCAKPGGRVGTAGPIRPGCL